MSAQWNSVHLFLYNGLSRNAHRRVFVDCAALRFIMSIKKLREIIYCKTPSEHAFSDTRLIGNAIVDVFSFLHVVTL